MRAKRKREKKKEKKEGTYDGGRQGHVSCVVEEVEYGVEEAMVKAVHGRCLRRWSGVTERR